MSAEDHRDQQTRDRGLDRRSVLPAGTGLAAASVLAAAAPTAIAQAQPAAAICRLISDFDGRGAVAAAAPMPGSGRRQP